MSGIGRLTSRALPASPQIVSSAAAPAAFTAADRIRRLWRNHGQAAWSLADQSIISAANFLSILLLARFLPAVEFGVFMLMHTGLLLITSLQTSLLTQPHNILGAKLEGAAYHRFTGALVLAQALFGSLLCGVLAIVGVVLWHAVSRDVGIAIVALALAAMPWMAQEFVRRVLYTTSATRRAAANDSLCYGLQLAGVVLLVSFAAPAQLNAVSAIAIFGASSLVAVVFGAWQLRRQTTFHGKEFFHRYARAAWARVWNFGRWLLGQNVTTWLGANGHVWVVGALLGAEVVGLYRAAIHLVNVINPLRQAAYAYLPARGSVAFKTGGHAGLSRWVRRVSWRLFLPLAPIVLVLVAMPERMLALAYGDKFSGMGLGIILALAVVAQTISFARYPMETAVLASGAPRWLFYINLLPIALLATLGVALILSLGIVGVPLSMLAISVASFAATYFIYRRLMNPASINSTQGRT